MTVAVRVPTVLRPVVDGAAVVEATGATLAEVIADVDRLHPGFAAAVLEADGMPKRFLSVFVGDHDARYLQGMQTPVPDGGEVIVLPAIAGGRS